MVSGEDAADAADVAGAGAGGVAAGEQNVDYLADFVVANVYCELLQSGQQQPGLDPGPAAIVATASSARAILDRIYHPVSAAATADQRPPS